MKRTIFYSWQSDLTAAVTRNLIEQSLERALQSIKRDADVLIDPALDRDTAGIPGAPSITETIFAKILMSNAFVADVSIINSQTSDRPTPNPNVLIELGYAVAHLGWDRVILVQNASFGGPEALPFDLRGRRVLSYELAPAAPDRPHARSTLSKRLETALRDAVGDSADTALLAGPAVPLWWGEWNTVDDGGYRGGRLFIREVGAAGFWFDISVFNGAHAGALEGFARLVGPDFAYARISAGDSRRLCELSFRRSVSGGTRRITVDEEGDCSWFRGMGAQFTGTFIWTGSALFDLGVLDELDLARLYRITRQFFKPMSESFQLISQTENLDPFRARATSGGVRGLFTIVEGIVLRGEEGQLWAAYIDDDVVRYFTTEGSYRERLPATIENWRKSFEDKPVIFDSEIDVMPSQS